MAGLDVGSFPVRKIVLDKETCLDGDVLRVNRSELQELILADPRMAGVDIEVVEPGESARVIHVCDAIEPRFKIAGPGACYPGVLGPMDTVGEGITHRLQGMSVVLSAEYPRLIETGTGAPREAILDMSGPGALSPLSHWIGAGNAFIESMLTVQALERQGIKAVFMTYCQRH